MFSLLYVLWLVSDTCWFTCYKYEVLATAEIVTIVFFFKLTNQIGLCTSIFSPFVCSVYELKVFMHS